LSWKLLFQKDIKIVHLHGASKGSFYRMYILFLLSKYIFHKKVVYHIHGGGFRHFYEQSGIFIKRLIEHIMNHSDLIICLSKYWYQYFDETFKIKDLYILNNPVLQPSNTCLPKVRGAKIHFLFLGLIGKGKGIFDLLKVVTQL